MSDQADPLALPLRQTPAVLRWWLALCVVALAAGFTALFLWAPGPSIGKILQEPDAYILFVLILLADIYPSMPWMRNSDGLDQFILSTPLAIAALMVFGPHAAVLFVVAGTVMSLVLRPVWWRVALNGILWGIQGLLAAGAMVLVTGSHDWSEPMTSLMMIPVTLALAVVIESSNILLVGTSWRLAGANSWREYFTDWHSQIAVGALALTAPIPAVIAQVHPALLLLLALAIIAAQSGVVAVASRTALASTDPLTSLANRATLMARLRVRMGQIRQPGDTVTLLLVDLDRFKEINDKLGHLTGDRVLVEVARRLEESTRAADLVARFGGDEFAVLLAGGVSQRSVDEVADRIRIAVARPIQVHDRTLIVGVTVGSAAVGERGTDLLALIQRADAELYRAKSARPGEQAREDAAAADRAAVVRSGADRIGQPVDAVGPPAIGWDPPRWSLTRSGRDRSVPGDGTITLTGAPAER